ncbi:taste receptor type 2 member 3-like [Pleurodeles waltl]|uniref:taste receptor type 2 member 3-like n=1 Tax=Pleurodeles waltl TaxID=8319 RepID=UPI0037093AF2
MVTIDMLMGIITSLEYFLGILINTFIAAVISQDMAKTHHLTSCEAIALIIAMSRASLLSADLTYLLYLLFRPETKVPQWLSDMVTFFSMFLSFYSYWLTALLYVYYCVTIANFRQLLFSLLKAKVPQWMPRLILGSSVVSLLYAVPSPWIFHELYSHNSTTEYTGNFRSEDFEIKTKFLWPVFYYTLGYSPPFLIFCVSAILRIASLFRHTRRMLRSASDISPPHMDAHYRAVKTVLAFSLLFALYYAACLCERMSPLFPPETWGLVHPVITQWYPVVHSAILIRSCPKLNKAAVRTLGQAKCWKKRISIQEQM